MLALFYTFWIYVALFLLRELLKWLLRSPPPEVPKEFRQPLSAEELRLAEEKFLYDLAEVFVEQRTRSGVSRRQATYQLRAIFAAQSQLEEADKIVKKLQEEGKL